MKLQKKFDNWNNIQLKDWFYDMSIIDTLGLLAHFVIFAKLIIQEIWTTPTD